MAVKFCYYFYFAYNNRNWLQKHIVVLTPHIQWTKSRVLLRSHWNEKTTAAFHPVLYIISCSFQSMSPIRGKRTVNVLWKLEFLCFILFNGKYSFKHHKQLHQKFNIRILSLNNRNFNFWFMSFQWCYKCDDFVVCA